MQDYTITGEQLQAFRQRLVWEEKSPATIEKYLRDAAAFTAWLDGRAASKAAAGAWKAALLEAKLAAGHHQRQAGGGQPVPCISGLAGVSGEAPAHPAAAVPGRQPGADEAEYLRLLETARTQGRERLALLLETICGTGIRVSEVRYVTVEAVYRGRAEISLKGKIRTILLPGKLCRKLLKYARKQKIASGEIFLTRNEKGISRRQIWAEMKALCDKAGVAPSKVFPHNLRHLFAKTFYRVCRDVARLADVLGHSSIETTRIYLISTGTEHAGTLARLGLVC